MVTCACLGCEGRVKALGLCPKHYQQKKRECPTFRKTRSEKQRAYMNADPARKERHRVYIRQWKTGFTSDLVERLRCLQRGSCAICSCVLEKSGRGLSSECADHDHTTGGARGLLCGACNRALGLYEKHQRPAGLVLEAYERYLCSWPSSLLPTSPLPQTQNQET